jgi:hypothetical protein
MDFNNYSGLQATIASYLARTDLTSQIPVFIQMAETRLTRNLRTRPMLKVVTTTVTDGTVTLPTDFLELRDVHIQGNPNVVFQYQSPDLFFRNELTSTSGITVFYTLIGQEFQFAPVPNGTQTLQMLYYAEPVSLSSTQPSNVYLANYSDALLYASLGEAEMYLMNDARVQSWAALYDRAIRDIKLNDEGGKYPNAILNVVPR